MTAFVRRQAERVRWVGRRLLLRVFGREIRCAECGRPMFHGIAFVWRGRVRLLGAYTHDLRVSFGSDDTLELRHIVLHECPAPDRPWAG